MARDDDGERCTGWSWSNVQLDGVRCVRQDPGLRQSKYVESVVGDDIVDERHFL